MGCAQQGAVSFQANWQLWTQMPSTNTSSLISLLSSSTAHHWPSNLSSSAKTTASSSQTAPAYSGRASQISSRYNVLELQRGEPASHSLLFPGSSFLHPRALHGSTRESTGKKDCYRSVSLKGRRILGVFSIARSEESGLAGL